MKKFIIAVSLFFSLLIPNIIAQKISVSKIEPPNWWTGMKTNKIQLMIYGENLGGVSAEFNNPGIRVTDVHNIGNDAYTFIDIEIGRLAAPDEYELTLSKGNKKTAVKFPLLQRKSPAESHKGFNASDVIYLIMPDRFADGDTGNNKVKGYNDPFDTVKYQKRAGGDLQGIINKLGYLKDLGATCLWLTPVVENNTFRSYHGYAATDFYKVDPRLGTNELYAELVRKAHEVGVKIILDHVSNHFSNDHAWIKNLPVPGWINGTMTDHLNANHQKMEFTDPYADSSVIKHIERGWFTNEMPDLNQENPFVANYIIQNTIWWVEYAGIDGIREDTYPYNNQKFMGRWAEAVINEYPRMNIVGEVWTGDAAFLAGYQGNTFLPRAFNTHLPALTDFALRDVMIGFLQGQNDLSKIFEVLAKDYLYRDAANLVTFADNHDLARVMYFAKGDAAKARLIYTILFTTRGIPSILYGSEIGLRGGSEHGELRMPFPGGFAGDGHNAFMPEGRTENEKNMFDFFQTLLKIRKEHPALYSGRLIHFPPENNVYFYFRILPNEKLLVLVNGNSAAVKADLGRAKNYLRPGAKLINLETGEEILTNKEMSIEVPSNHAGIYKISE